MTDVPDRTPAREVTWIRAPMGWPTLGLGEVWARRELLLFLAWRDVKVRYRQTVLGIAWAVLQPLLMTAVFTLLLGRYAGLAREVDGVPYASFVLCALLPWQLFTHSLSQAANSLVNEQRLIAKIYFPRLIIPMAPMFSACLDFAVGAVLLLGVLAAQGVAPSARAALLPLFFLLALLAALGVGVWLAALNARYRDVRYTLPFLTQLWMFATPIIYPITIVPESVRGWLALNPLAGIVEGFRWCILGQSGLSPQHALLSAAGIIPLLVGGLYFFRRTENVLADVV